MIVFLRLPRSSRYDLLARNIHLADYWIVHGRTKHFHIHRLLLLHRSSYVFSPLTSKTPFTQSIDPQYTPTRFSRRSTRARWSATVRTTFTATQQAIKWRYRCATTRSADPPLRFVFATSVVGSVELTRTTLLFPFFLFNLRSSTAPRQIYRSRSIPPRILCMTNKCTKVPRPRSGFDKFLCFWQLVLFQVWKLVFADIELDGCCLSGGRQSCVAKFLKGSGILLLNYLWINCFAP